MLNDQSTEITFQKTKSITNYNQVYNRRINYGSIRLKTPRNESTQNLLFVKDEYINLLNCLIASHAIIAL